MENLAPIYLQRYVMSLQRNENHFSKSYVGITPITFCRLTYTRLIHSFGQLHGEAQGQSLTWGRANEEDLSKRIPFSFQAAYQNSRTKQAKHTAHLGRLPANSVVVSLEEKEDKHN